MVGVEGGSLSGNKVLLYAETQIVSVMFNCFLWCGLGLGGLKYILKTSLYNCHNVAAVISALIYMLKGLQLHCGQ